MVKWLLTVVAALIGLGGVGPAWAASSVDRALMKLDPEERAHQVCAIKGLETVRRRDKRLTKADRLMPDTFKRALFEDNVVTAKGAAVRSDKHWYALTFRCTVSSDQLKAVDFDFEIGDEVPRERWDDVGLWP